MLAARPMLVFAIAAMAGIMTGRYLPEASVVLSGGWGIFFLGSVWFILAKPAPAPLLSTTSRYAAHLHPTPGFLARRGLNRFVLIVCLGLFLSGIARQSQWQRALTEATLPGGWFSASLVADAPNRAYPGERGRWRVPATVFLVDGRGIRDTRVQLQGSVDVSFRRGDIIQARVWRFPDRPPAFPGAFAPAFFLERDGGAATLAAARPRRGSSTPQTVVVPVDSPSVWVSARRFLDDIRGLAILRTLEYGGEEGGMLAAMLYGYRKDTSAVIRDAFRRVGIGHVLAISGLHVGMIVGILWWLGGWSGWSRQGRAVLCMMLAVVYLGLSGGAVAATRATFMALIHLAGMVRGRGADMLNSLGAAALIIVFVNPTAPLDVSFQLSFTAVVFIYLALRRSPGDARPRPLGHGESARARAAWREARSLARLSVATSVGLFPIIAVVFKQVNVIGLAINIIVIPLMAFVLAGGLLLPWLGWIPGTAFLLTILGKGIVWLAVFCDRLPGSSFAVHGPSLMWVALYYGVILLWMLRPLVPDRFPRPHVTRGVMAAFGCVVLGLAASMRSLPPPAGGRIAVLPGGRLGSMVVEAADGGIAVLGDIPRGGLQEAEWLHYLRRAGPVAVVGMGRAGEERVRELAYHAGIDETTFLIRRHKAGAGVKSGWRPVPGAETVEYALERDDRGRIARISARTGELSATLEQGKAVAAAEVVTAGGSSVYTGVDWRSR